MSSEARHLINPPTMHVSWKGVYPAVTTKFNPDDTLDFAMFGKNLDAQIDAGVDAIVLGGTLGEASTLDDAEKLDLLSFALAHVNDRVPVILNVTEGATRRAVSYIKKADDLGTDGFMALPPMRYKSDDLETVAFFKAMADADTEAEEVIGRTGTVVSMEADERYGQLEIAANGAPLLINVRTQPGAPALPKGTQAKVTTAGPGNAFYFIESLKS